MLERELTVSNRLGLHARATAKLVQTLAPFRCNVTMAAKGREINAKSIMGVMLLAAGQGTRSPCASTARTKPPRWRRWSACSNAASTRTAERATRTRRPALPANGRYSCWPAMVPPAERRWAARVRLPHALEVAEQRVAAHQVEAELARLHRALDAARTEMHELRQRLHGALNQEVGEFLDLHALLLDDPSCCMGWTN
jgi:phosphotransferase system HPr (HPr) family protein